MKVGYLGPKGTFSYEACLRYCKNEKAMVEFKTIPAVILAVKNGQVEEAIVPIENSIQGCVTNAIDTLIENKEIKVKDEMVLAIRQNLVTNKACKLKEIKKIYSHPQALAQCRNFLEENFPLAEIIAVDSTASSAQIISKSTEICGCIVNAMCAKEYNLFLLRKDIQDNMSNKTRFWVLSKSGNKNQKKNKMSILIYLKDKPGSLFNALAVFDKYQINLTKIESRPAKTVLGEYIFWIDFILNDNFNAQVIKEIAEKANLVRVLGKY